MAIKDWKKTKVANWIKKIDTRPSTLWKNKQGQGVGIIRDATGVWWFKWSSNNRAMGKKFKTKKQALDYAKKYMKNN